MRLAQILITLLLIGGFVSGFIGFYGALAGAYGKTSRDFAVMNATSRMYNNTYADATNMGLAVNESQGKSFDLTNAVTGAPLNLVFGAYNAMVLLLQAPIYFNDIFVDFMHLGLGVPGWVGTMVFGIISIIVLFAVIGFLTGRDV